MEPDLEPDFEADFEPDPELVELRSELETAADGVIRRDLDAEDAARVALTTGRDERTRLGRLAEWGIWLSGAQGTFPPRPPARAHLVRVRSGTSQRSSTSQGNGAAADSTTEEPAQTSDLHVGSSILDLAAGSSMADAARRGVAAVDHAVDGGADLLIFAQHEGHTSSAALVALLQGLSAVDVVGDAAHLGEAEWADLVAAVRDTMRTARPAEDDPAAIVLALGSTTLCALVAMALRAAARRTPVLLDGLADTAAALCASRFAVLASWWWFAASTSSDPGVARAQEALGLVPLVDLSSRLDGGDNALVALPLLHRAGALMQTVVIG